MTQLTGSELFPKDPKSFLKSIVDPEAGDPAIEEGDLERDLPELDEKDLEESDESGKEEDVDF